MSDQIPVLSKTDQISPERLYDEMESLHSAVVDQLLPVVRKGSNSRIEEGDIERIVDSVRPAKPKSNSQTPKPTPGDDTQTRINSKLVEVLGDFISSLGPAMANAQTQAVHTMLGPMRLVTDPLNDFFGGNLMQSMGGTLKKLIPEKGTTADTTKKKVIEKAPWAVWLANQLTGKKDKEGRLGLGARMMAATGLSSLLTKMKGGLSTAGGNIAKMLGSKAFGIGSLAAGVAMAIYDGVQGWIDSEDWGVSKVAGAIGGFLAGGEGGLKNAFKNAGKWALIGAGAGSLIAGPVGAIAGGLIGAAFGGILGFIGGDKVAKAVDRVGEIAGTFLGPVFEKIKSVFNWLKEKITQWYEGSALKSVVQAVGLTLQITFDAIKKPFVAVWDAATEIWNRMKGIWNDEDTSMVSKIGNLASEVLLFLPRMVISWVRGIVDGITGWFSDMFQGEDSGIAQWKDAVLHVFTSIPETISGWISGAFGAIGEFVTGLLRGEESDELMPRGKKKSLFRKIGEVIHIIGENIFEFIGDLFKDAWQGIKSTITGTVDLGRDALGWSDTHIKQPIEGFFINTASAVREKAATIIDTAKGWVEGNIISPVTTLFTNIKMGVQEFFEDPIGSMRDVMRGIIEKVGGFFSSIKEHFTVISQAGLGNIFNDEAHGRVAALREAGVDVDRLKEVARDEIWGVNRTNVGTKLFGGDHPDTLRQALRAAGYDPDIVSVNDAIIRPNGDIIRTHPNDTLIATQSPIGAFDDKGVNLLRSDMQTTLEEQRGGAGSQDIVAAIRQLISTVQNKPFNNYVQNNTQYSNEFDFNNLRFAAKGAE